MRREQKQARPEAGERCQRLEDEVDLPNAPHDVATITTLDVLVAFERYVAAGDDLRRLLEARHVDNE